MKLYFRNKSLPAVIYQIMSCCA